MNELSKQARAVLDAARYDYEPTPSDRSRVLGALTAALNWYRANISAESFGLPVPMPLPPVACPVLGVWSESDVACGEAQMLASRERVTGLWRYHRISGVGHWIPLAAADELSALLVGHLRQVAALPLSQQPG